jgi:hypothetical protein
VLQQPEGDVVLSEQTFLGLLAAFSAYPYHFVVVFGLGWLGHLLWGKRQLDILRKQLASAALQRDGAVEMAANSATALAAAQEKIQVLLQPGPQRRHLSESLQSANADMERARFTNNEVRRFLRYLFHG